MGAAKTVIDRLPEVLKALELLVSKKVLVGIPDAKAGRRDGPASNAVIGYVQETGDPRRNLPARPFLVPGVASIRGDVVAGLGNAGRLALDGKPAAVERQLAALGLLGQNAVRKRITDGIPPPLAASTVAGRLRRTRKGKRLLAQLRASGADLGQFGADNYTPLIATGQLRQSITYVIRTKLPQNWPKPPKPP